MNCHKYLRHNYFQIYRYNKNYWKWNSLYRVYLLLPRNILLYSCFLEYYHFLVYNLL